jgi:hypothetical protein
MWTAKFWKEATERAIKTAAQVALVFLGIDGGGLLTLNWTVAGVAIAGGALASYATSVVSAASGPGEITPNFREGKTVDGNPNTDA